MTEPEHPGRLEKAQATVRGAGRGISKFSFSPGRNLGAASALLGRPDEARGYYEQALAVCEKVRFRPEIALIRLELAELLVEHFSAVRTDALAHLDFAITEFEAMKMAPALERARQLRGRRA